ncbi:hypothetical protein PG996_007779 [Apiospora saccharicola]|uniref:Uncharacterized protein n=1 Tax=Apiospora saccharicola TaxID=335842 RepID=A0ABR1UWT6_9PEZI
MATSQDSLIIFDPVNKFGERRNSLISRLAAYLKASDSQPLKQFSEELISIASGQVEHVEQSLRNRGNCEMEAELFEPNAYPRSENPGAILAEAIVAGVAWCNPKSPSTKKIISLLIILKSINGSLFEEGLHVCFEPAIRSVATRLQFGGALSSDPKAKWAENQETLERFNDDVEDGERDALWKIIKAMQEFIKRFGFAGGGFTFGGPLLSTFKSCLFLSVPPRQPFVLLASHVGLVRSHGFAFQQQPTAGKHEIVREALKLAKGEWESEKGTSIARRMMIDTDVSTLGKYRFNYNEPGFIVFDALVTGIAWTNPTWTRIESLIDIMGNLKDMEEYPFVHFLDGDLYAADHTYSDYLVRSIRYDGQFPTDHQQRLSRLQGNTDGCVPSPIMTLEEAAKKLFQSKGMLKARLYARSLVENFAASDLFEMTIRQPVEDPKLRALCIKTSIACIKRDGCKDYSAFLQKWYYQPILQDLSESDELESGDLKRDAIKIKDAMQSFIESVNETWPNTMSNNVVRLVLFTQHPEGRMDEASCDFFRKFNYVAEFLYQPRASTEEEAAIKALRLAKGEDSLEKKRFIPKHDLVDPGHFIDALGKIDINNPVTTLVHAIAGGIVWMNPTLSGIEYLLKILAKLKDMQGQEFLDQLAKDLEIASASVTEDDNEEHKLEKSKSLFLARLYARSLIGVLDSESVGVVMGSAKQHPVEDPEMHALCIRTGASCIALEKSKGSTGFLQKWYSWCKVTGKFKKAEGIWELWQQALQGISQTADREDLKLDVLAIIEAMQSFSPSEWRGQSCIKKISHTIVTEVLLSIVFA